MAEYRETGNNDDFLKELRDNYAADQAEWEPIAREGRTDIRFVGGDAWDAAERRSREANNRLCLNFDELSQYTNQCINDILQNKRAVKVTPNGNGANDQEAELRANRIRQIEYRSNAQQAYTTMFENTIQRSFGWVRIISKYLNQQKSQQELIIQAVPNPDMITPGPFVMPDGSDIKRLWFHEWRTHTEFKREFPKAKVKDFGSSDLLSMPGVSSWLSPDRVMVSEYWVKKDDDSVCQYFTNGLEVFKKTEWPGKDLPFVPCFGKVLYVTEGGKTDRHIHSLIRLARDPFRAYCYVRTSEAELLSQLPKFPYFIRRGSLTPDELVLLQKSVSEPVAVIQIEPMIAEMSATGPPEFPQRNPLDLGTLAGMDAIAEACRRAIQAAIGQSPLPTTAQRRNEKSGVALKQIEDSGQRGSYHFTAHYEAAITRVGLILNDLLKPYHSDQQEMTVRKPDDTTQVVRMNDPGWVNPDTQQPQHLTFSDASFDVTLSTGPQNDSQREAQSDFADLLLQSPEIAQIIGPQNMAKVLAKVIKLKNVGPLGDAIADIIDPPQQQGQVDPQQQQAMMQKAQQTMDTQSKQLEALTETIKTDKVKVDGQIEIARMNNAARIEVAKIAAMSKGVQVQLEADEEMIALGYEQQHEATQNEQDRQHEAAMAAMNHEQGMQAGAQQGAQASQQSAQDHQQQLEQGAMGHEQALEQNQQTADLAPPEAGA